MKKYVTELTGTFLFVFSIALAVVHAGPLAPLAIGGALMCVVYMGGHISGGHYNPAVTLAVYVRGKIGGGEALRYMVAQLVGAALAALAGSAVTGQAFVAAPPVGYDVFGALLVEVTYTFALALVVLNVATDDEVAGNSFYGLAIGFTVVVAAFAGGAVSGGAFNPAVGLGPALVAIGRAPIDHTWLYAVGPFAGAALASAVYSVQHPNAA
ncbi:MAG: aquaporin [Myxococcales bacterium]|nr:aquaporin [Myxococcales bacterium]MCB9705030.1 aquaporin [Myxococcales bacterium]